MQVATILKSRPLRRCLTIAALAAFAAGFTSCATDKPQQTALVNDPDARAGSSIPWNKPAHWEGREGLPDTPGNDAFGSGGSRF